LNKSIVILAVAGSLMGCTRYYDVNVMGQASAIQGQTTIAVTTGHPSGEFSLQLNTGKHYHGRWIYVATGGSVSFGTATVISRTRYATANMTGFDVPTEGGGSVVATAEDGSTLNCHYVFNAMTRSGMGTCQENGGPLMDMQIAPSS
jgi:hypothetical protein